jgi:hypothetical protein
MSELLVKYDEPITAPDGTSYFAQAVGSEMQSGEWEGWIEFFPEDDAISAVESGRETTQPNRANLELWAQGLTAVYLEGALDRAISLVESPRKRVQSSPESGAFTGPAHRNTEPISPTNVAYRRAILDPFQVYAQGEQILRDELRALSRDHLESIALASEVGGARSSSPVKSLSTPDLIDAIVAEARDNPRRASPGSSEARPEL